jgi:hypothetical protein
VSLTRKLFRLKSRGDPLGISMKMGRGGEKGNEAHEGSPGRRRWEERTKGII